MAGARLRFEVRVTVDTRADKLKPQLAERGRIRGQRARRGVARGSGRVLDLHGLIDLSSNLPLGGLSAMNGKDLRPGNVSLLTLRKWVEYVDDVEFVANFLDVQTWVARGRSWIPGVLLALLRAGGRRGVRHVRDVGEILGIQLRARPFTHEFFTKCEKLNWELRKDYQQSS